MTWADRTSSYIRVRAIVEYGAEKSKGHLEKRTRTELLMIGFEEGYYESLTDCNCCCDKRLRFRVQNWLDWMSISPHN